MNATTWQLLHEKGRIWNALAIRELMSKYGHGNLGFVWLVIEPLMLTAGVMTVWSFLYGTSKHGINLFPFVLTGYGMLTLWRHAVASAVHCFSRSADLLYHRQISPLDIFLTRQLVDIFGVLIAFFAAYIPLRLLEITEPIDDYLTLLVAWFLMGFFCSGVALILACVSELAEVVERLVQPVMYLLMPASGAFYMVAWLPRRVQDAVAYIPMVDAMEMFRAGYFGPAVPTHWDAAYLFVCGVVVNVIGLAMVDRAIQKMEV